MKYGYARVSTATQNLLPQVEMLKAEGCTIICEERISGTRSDREIFNALLDELRSGDTLVVTKLDRFARSTHDALTVIADLFERNISVHVLNLGLIANTPTGKLIFTILSAFAEFERDLIVSRTQEGKAIARQKEGYREGRPKKFTKQQLSYALELLDTHSYKRVGEILGISKSTLLREKKRRDSVNE